MKGKELEQAVKMKWRNMQEAADAFGISRNHLYLLFKEEEIPIKYYALAKSLGLEGMVCADLKPVPVYDIDAAAGNVVILNDTMREHISGYICAPEFSDCDASIGVWGNSMCPVYCSGEKIVLKRITDWDIISFGEAHVFVTKERILLKYLRKGKDKDHWKLVSENKDEFESFEIPVKKVINLYIVKGKITKNII